MDIFDKRNYDSVKDGGNLVQRTSSPKKEKIDPRKLILYSEILKPKFDE